MKARETSALASRRHTAGLAPKRALVVWGIAVVLLLIVGLGSTAGSGPRAPAHLGRAAARSGAGDAGDARVVRGSTREVLVDSHRRHPAAAVSLQRRMNRLDIRGMAGVTWGEVAVPAPSPSWWFLGLVPAIVRAPCGRQIVVPPNKSVGALQGQSVLLCWHVDHRVLTKQTKTNPTKNGCTWRLRLQTSNDTRAAAPLTELAQGRTDGADVGRHAKTEQGTCE